MIEVRKLAAVDMALLGTHVTVSAYALGIVLPFLFGLFSLVVNLAAAQAAAWQLALGFWMWSVAANYAVLLAYSLSILKAGTAEQEGKPELERVRRYTAQQAMVLVPFMVGALALSQERRRQQATP